MRARLRGAPDVVDIITYLWMAVAGLWADIGKKLFGKSINAGYINQIVVLRSKLRKVPFMIRIALLVYHERPYLSMISFRSSSNGSATTLYTESARNTVVGPQPTGYVAQGSNAEW